MNIMKAMFSCNLQINKYNSFEFCITYSNYNIAEMTNCYKISFHKNILVRLSG